MLAKWYHDTFAAHFLHYVSRSGRSCRRRIPRDWTKRWPVVLQKRLDLTNLNTVAQQLRQFAIDFSEGRSSRFVRGPQCLPWPEPERKDTAVRVANSPNEPGATAPSGLPKPLAETPLEAAQISEVGTTENPS
jgi:hypothetical protein